MIDKLDSKFVVSANTMSLKYSRSDRPLVKEGGNVAMIVACTS